MQTGQLVILMDPNEFSLVEQHKDYNEKRMQSA